MELRLLTILGIERWESLKGIEFLRLARGVDKAVLEHGDAKIKTYVKQTLLMKAAGIYQLFEFGKQLRTNPGMALLAPLGMGRIRILWALPEEYMEELLGSGELRGLTIDGMLSLSRDALQDYIKFYQFPCFRAESERERQTRIQKAMRHAEWIRQHEGPGMLRSLQLLESREGPLPMSAATVPDHQPPSQRCEGGTEPRGRGTTTATVHPVARDSACKLQAPSESDPGTTQCSHGTTATNPEDRETKGADARLPAHLRSEPLSTVPVVPEPTSRVSSTSRSSCASSVRYSPHVTDDILSSEACEGKPEIDRKDDLPGQ